MSYMMWMKRQLPVKLTLKVENQTIAVVMVVVAVSLIVCKTRLTTNQKYFLSLIKVKVKEHKR